MVARKVKRPTRPKSCRTGRPQGEAGAEARVKSGAFHPPEGGCFHRKNSCQWAVVSRVKRPTQVRCACLSGATRRDKDGKRGVGNYCIFRRLVHHYCDTGCAWLMYRTQERPRVNPTLGARERWFVPGSLSPTGASAGFPIRWYLPSSEL